MVAFVERGQVLTRDAALKLEQALQERACGIGGKRCDRSSMLYCKYDPNMIWKTAQ